MRRHLRRQRLSVGRRFFPRDDRRTRRHAHDTQADFDTRSIEREAGERAQRGLERERRRTEHEPAREVQFGHRLGDELPLRRAGAEDGRAAAGPDEMAQEAEACLAGMFDVPCRGVGDDDDVGADGRLDRLGGASAVVLKLSMGEDCWMSRALPRAT